MEIEKKLEDLELMFAKRDFIEFQKRQMISSVLTPEIEQELADIEEEFAPDLEAIGKAIKMAENDIKEEVRELGETVQLPTIQAIYRKGRTLWDTKGLQKYAEEHPEIGHFKKQSKPSVSIQPRKVKS